MPNLVRHVERTGEDDARVDTQCDAFHLPIVIADLGVKVIFSRLQSELRTAKLDHAFARYQIQHWDVGARRKLAHEVAILRANGERDCSVANFFLSFVRQTYGERIPCAKCDGFIAKMIKNHEVADPRQTRQNRCLVRWYPGVDKRSCYALI